MQENYTNIACIEISDSSNEFLDVLLSLRFNNHIPMMMIQYLYI